MTAIGRCCKPDPLAKLERALLRTRSAVREVADLIVDTGNQSVSGLAHRLEQKLAKFAARAPLNTEPAAHRVRRHAHPERRARRAQLSYTHRRGPLARPELIVPHLPQKRVAIVTNETVAPLYLDALIRRLQSAGYRCVPIVLPDGEAHKNWETLNTVFDTLLEHRCERRTAIVALGGGVVGDIAGFAAAVYQRGVPFVQMPTTLLAQVDSAVARPPSTIRWART